MGTSGGQQQASALPRRTISIEPLALVVVDRGWYLNRLGQYGLAIGGAVRVVAAMAEKGWLGA